MEGIVDVASGAVKYPSGLVRSLAIARTVQDMPRIVEIVADRGAYLVVAKPLTAFEVPFPRECIFRMSPDLAKLAHTHSGGGAVDARVDWSDKELFAE